MTRAAATLEAHDFRQPRQLMPSSWRTLQRWYSEGCELVAERWRKLGLDVTLSHQRTRVLSLRSALEAVPEPGWGARGILGAQSIETLLACPPGRLRSLVSRMLGDTPDDAEQVESLTAFEESIAELLIAEFLKAFGDAWPGAEPLSCRFLESVNQPQRTRMYLPRTTLVVTTFRVGPVTEQNPTSDENEESEPPATSGDEIVWIMPQMEIEDLIEIECATPVPQRTTPHPAIPRIMRDVPVSVTVELGRTHLSMSELTSLQAGDVVILEQLVTRPLNVRVGNTFKFRGRPGRIGVRRCLEIQQILEDAPDGLTAALPH